MNIKENIKLAPYTTYKIGGPAKYFVEVSKKQEVLEALEFAKSKDLKYFILCGGSNVLFSDEGYDGLVIKLDLEEIGIRDNVIYAESGVKLMALINRGLDNKLTGLEFLAGVPGEVGGAIRGNAGAFGKEIKDFIKMIEIVRDGKIMQIRADEAEFKYRDSIFKHNDDIILSGQFELKEGNVEKARALVEERINYRKENHPMKPSAGSIFKNPKNKSVGSMVEKLELKGHKVGDAQISEKHGNFIVNLGKAKAEDVKELMKLVREKIKEKYKIELEEEIMIVE